MEAIYIIQDTSLHQTQALLSFFFFFFSVNKHVTYMSAVARRLNTATNFKYCGVILKMSYQGVWFALQIDNYYSRIIKV